MQFIDVITAVKEAVPKVKPVHSYWFVIKDNPHFQIKISKPSPFDSYGDMVAKITVYKDDKPVWNVLLTIDTDLNKFCQRLLQKLKENHYEV